jgi:hypothetical protein
MKNVAFILFTIILNSVLFSCTPDSIVEQSTEQACCDEDFDIPPPPPPPPPGGKTGD